VLELKLKLLTGTLNGAEYAIGEGDAVFVVGQQKELLSGSVGQTLAHADNIYFVPDERAQLTFIIRHRQPVQPTGLDGTLDELQASGLQLGTTDEAGQWHFEPIQLQCVHRAGDVHLAVRPADEFWASTVLDYEPPRSPLTVTSGNSPGPQRTAWRLWAAGALVLAAVAVGVLAWMYHQAPETQVTTLEAELRSGPVDYAIAYGSDKRLYAFVDTAQGVAWGQRAVERLGKQGEAVFVERAAETRRLGRRLTEAGIDYVTIRLRDPAQPQIVLAAPDHDAAQIARARALLAPAMAYAKQLHIEAISDRTLVAMVRDDLLSRGITSRVDVFNHRVGVSNDAFLDDAGLNTMARYRQGFVDQWGARRISINILLWDDMLKGNSFHYAPEQLLSMGDGVWSFANPVHSVPANLEDTK
jgi:type III secretion system PrgH/EprH family protein